MTDTRMQVLGLMAAAEPLWTEACEECSEGESVAIIRAQPLNPYITRHHTTQEPHQDQECTMTRFYKQHNVTTVEEVNALALTDRQENGSLVICDGMLCLWSLPYAVRNERDGEWLFVDGQIYDGDEVAVLVPIEAEEEWTIGHDSPAWATGTEEWAREPQTHEPGRRLFRRLVTPWEEA